MGASELKFETLVGRTVRNQHGRAIGRIEDVRVEPDGEDYVVTEFVLGPLEWIPRLRRFLGQLPTLRGMGLGRGHEMRPIPWRWIDLSDPLRPVLSAEWERTERTEKTER
jgi:sporulation protein YlmC with PRC-barrel domain